jgi:hypothetical protein
MTTQNDVSSLSIVVADATSLMVTASESCLEPETIDAVMSQSLAMAKDLTGIERATYVCMLPSFREALECDLVEHQARKLS